MDFTAREEIVVRVDPLGETELEVDMGPLQACLLTSEQHQQARGSADMYIQVRGDLKQYNTLDSSGFWMEGDEQEQPPVHDLFRHFEHVVFNRTKALHNGTQFGKHVISRILSKIFGPSQIPCVYFDNTLVMNTLVDQVNAQYRAKVRTMLAAAYQNRVRDQFNDSGENEFDVGDYYRMTIKVKGDGEDYAAHMKKIVVDFVHDKADTIAAGPPDLVTPAISLLYTTTLSNSMEAVGAPVDIPANDGEVIAIGLDVNTSLTHLATAGDM